MKISKVTNALSFRLIIIGLFAITSTTVIAQQYKINAVGVSSKLIYNFPLQISGIDTATIYPNYWIVPELHLEMEVLNRTYLTFSAGAWGYKVRQEGMIDHSKEVAHKLVQKRALNLSFNLGMDYALVRDQAGLPIIAFNLNAGYLSTGTPHIEEHFILKDDFFARKLTYDFERGHGFNALAGFDLRIKVKRLSIRGEIFYNFTRFQQKYNISSNDGYYERGTLQTNIGGPGISLGVFYRLN